MATSARTIATVATDETGVLNTDIKVTFADASAGDITQLGSNKVVLIVDADSTAKDKAIVLSHAEAAVYALRRQLGLVNKPSQLSTSTVVIRRPR